MKLGIEHRPTIIAGILISFAALVVFLESPRRERAVPLTCGPERVRPTTAEPGNTKHDPWFDPTLHDQELKLAENRFYKGTGRNIFRSDYLIHRTSIPNPPMRLPSRRIAEPLVPLVTMRLFGFASLLNQPPKALLGEGDSVFVAKEGDIVNRRYRVLQIDSNFVVLEDLIESSLHKLTLHS